MLTWAQGSLSICMEQVAHQAPHFIIVWYGQVLTHWCDLCQTLRDIQAIKLLYRYISVKTNIMGKKLLLQWNLELVTNILCE